jgi:hypothetical protein
LKTKRKLRIQIFGQPFYSVLRNQKFQYRRDPENFDFFSPVPDSEISGSEKSDSDFQAGTTAKKPELFTQNELSDLAREHDFPKDLAEILESRLCEKTLSAQRRRTSGTDIEKIVSMLLGQRSG